MLTVLAAGCGGTRQAAAPSAAPTTSGAVPVPRSSAPTSSSSPLVTPTSTLTGLPTTQALAGQPVVAVALAAGDGAAPPSGLDAAELVYVEYSDTLRMLALYQTVSAPQIGPVAPTRPADGATLSVTQAIYANTGGPKGFLTTLHNYGVLDASNALDPAAYHGGAGGVFTSTEALRQAVTGAKSPPPLLTFAQNGEPLARKATAAHRVVVTIPGRTSTTWTYDEQVGGWRSSEPAFGAATPNTLLIQQVPYKTVQVHHPDGPLVPSARVFKYGNATIVSGTSAVTDGRWRKPGPEAFTTFGSADGVPVDLAPGVVWVLLVPVGAQVTVS